MKTPYRLLSIVSALILFVVSPLLRAQTYTDIHDFINTDGCCASYPSLLAQGEDGNIYGATTSGGAGAGNIFEITPTGTFNNLFNFNGTNGRGPQGGLSLGFDGNFYGTTYQGGTNAAGTVFKITSSGTQTVLYNFMNTTDGGFPKVPPVQAPDGNLYGTTGNGTVATLYKITPSGTFSVVVNLPAQSYSPLLVGTDGNLYGTTLFGGTFNRGTAFQFSPTKKKLKIIHNFEFATDGSSPTGPLMQGVDGKLYGTTSAGGTSSGGVLFQMSTAGKTVVLVNFDTVHEANGATPFAGVVQGSDGFLYGVASVGGANGLGTLFKVSTKGTGFAVLHDFGTATGDTPLSTPLLHTNGKIYGIAFHGGSHTAYGAIYSFDAGLNPFASQFVIYSGKVGDSISVLGQGFSNATGVKFGTGAGTFVAGTDSFMTATVDAGATTGVITVLEPGGNLATPQKFKIIPTISGFSPKSGPVGTQVVITGMSLKQTSSVTIGKKAASFVVNSDTQVTATVAAGAVTGKVTL
ncbi:MAG TPA: choice-of-anchor tandem repeat GloVer-containing protein, partial [Terriglobales bacterium]|nr:choice-of-anchor tandem repeat GloVer-containing protein [Terriglobales bacterium]